MDTKLTNNVETFKSIFAGSLLRQIVIVMIFTILVGMSGFDFLANNKFEELKTRND